MQRDCTQFSKLLHSAQVLCTLRRIHLLWCNCFSSVQKAASTPHGAQWWAHLFHFPRDPSTFSEGVWGGLGGSRCLLRRYDWIPRACGLHRAEHCAERIRMSWMRAHTCDDIPQLSITAEVARQVGFWKLDIVCNRIADEAATEFAGSALPFDPAWFKHVQTSST